MPTDLPELAVGDHVQDRDDPESTMLVVVGRLVPTAENHTVNGRSIASLNPDYPADDPVIEAVYPQPHHVDVANAPRYAFPRSRLDRTHGVHATRTDDEADGGEEVRA